MPRSRGRSAPVSRAPPSRQSHTMAAPAPTHTPAPARAAPPMTEQRQPGLFSQMASTAAGVAVGSAVGHTLANGVSSIFGGGSSSQVSEPAAAAPVQAQQSQWNESARGQCEVNARQLTECMDQNNGDMRVCQWYMDQLKSCLNAASNY